MQRPEFFIKLEDTENVSLVNFRGWIGKYFSEGGYDKNKKIMGSVVLLERFPSSMLHPYVNALKYLDIPDYMSKTLLGVTFVYHMSDELPLDAILSSNLLYLYKIKPLSVIDQGACSGREILYYIENKHTLTEWINSHDVPINTLLLNTPNRTKLLMDKIIQDYDKKYGVSLQKEERKKIPYVFQLDIGSLPNIMDMAAFFECMFSWTDNPDEFPQPTRLSSYVYEWLSVNGVNTIVYTKMACPMYYFMKNVKGEKIEHETGHETGHVYVVHLKPPTKSLKVHLNASFDEVFTRHNEILPSEKNIKENPTIRSIFDYAVDYSKYLKNSLNGDHHDIEILFTVFTSYSLYTNIVRAVYILVIRIAEIELPNKNNLFEALYSGLIYTIERIIPHIGILLQEPKFPISYKTIDKYLEKRNKATKELDDTISRIIILGHGFFVRSKSMGINAVNIHFQSVESMAMDLMDIFSLYDENTLREYTTSYEGFRIYLKGVYDTFESKTYVKSHETHEIIPLSTQGEETELSEGEGHKEETERRQMLSEEEEEHERNLEGPDLRENTERTGTLPFSLHTILEGGVKYGELSEYTDDNVKTELDLKLRKHDDAPNILVPAELSTRTDTTKEEYNIKISEESSVNAPIEFKVDSESLEHFPLMKPNNLGASKNGNISDLLFLKSCLPKSRVPSSHLLRHVFQSKFSCGMSHPNKEENKQMMAVYHPDVAINYPKISSYLRQRGEIKVRERAVATNIAKRHILFRSKMEDVFDAMCDTLSKDILPSDFVTTVKNILNEKKDLFSPQNLLIFEEIFSDAFDSTGVHTFKDADRVYGKTMSLLYNRFYNTVHGLNGVVMPYAPYIIEKEEQESQMFWNTIPGPPSIFIAPPPPTANVLVNTWYNELHIDSIETDLSMKNLYDLSAHVNTLSSNKRNLTTENICQYFHNILGINESSDYAFVNLAEFEARSSPSIAKSQPYFDSSAERFSTQFWENIWADVSSSGNLARLPKRVIQNDEVYIKLPNYLDMIKKDEWNGLRAIFFVSRIDSRNDAIHNLASTSKHPTEDTHWALMVFFTGVDKDGQQTKYPEFRYYDSFVHGGNMEGSEYILKQLILYKIVSGSPGILYSPRGNSINSSNLFSKKLSVEKGGLSPWGHRMLKEEHKGEAMDKYIDTLTNYKAFIEQIIKDSTMDPVDFYYITSKRPEDITKNDVKVVLSHAFTKGSLLYDVSFKNEYTPHSPIYTKRSCPWTKQIYQQKYSWECGYFVCAMTRHIITYGSVYSLPPNNAGIELSWAAEQFGRSVNFGMHPVVYVDDKEEILYGEKTLSFRPTETDFNEDFKLDVIEEGLRQYQKQMDNIYLQRMFHPTICSLPTNKGAWTKKQITIDVTSNEFDLSEYKSFVLEKDSTDKFYFGEALYAITSMKVFGTMYETYKMIQSMGQPCDYKGTLVEYPTIGNDVPWRPQVVKLSYPISSNPVGHYDVSVLKGEIEDTLDIIQKKYIAKTALYVISGYNPFYEENTVPKLETEETKEHKAFDFTHNPTIFTGSKLFQ